jgi:glycosyltransferase involved in cell wall biosynthesis
VCELLDRPEERQRLGANARAFAQQNYDLKTVSLPKQLAWVESLIT